MCIPSFLRLDFSIQSNKVHQEVLEIALKKMSCLRMFPAAVTFLAVFLVSACGYGVDSASAHIQCDSDHQCDAGFFCYEESHYCTRCVECSTYKRKSSWRSCPKTPSDCGVCIPGHEEEILHVGKTRDMCIPGTPNSLSHTNAAVHMSERYIWAAALIAVILPVAFFIFCRKKLGGDRGHVHHGLHREEPPPYRSTELTTLTSNNSEERLSEEDHVMQVGQNKDSLVQAVPFCQPNYVNSELMAFENIEEVNSDVAPSPDTQIVSTTQNVDLHDDNTMPSDWTPAENTGNGLQLMSFELPNSEESSEPEDTCEPANKRYKSSETQDEDDSCNTHLNINLFINNNVTIHKPS